MLRVTPVIVSDEAGRPIRTYTTEDEKHELQMIQTEVLASRTHAGFARVILEKIGAEYAPNQDELAEFFSTSLIDDYIANAIARAIEHFWQGRPDEAIHLALPRIEAILRNVVLATGGIAFTQPQGSNPGGVKPLGAILRELPNLPGEGWNRSLIVVLSEPVGLNLRNRYLHGLVEHSSKDDAAAVLHIAAYLRNLFTANQVSGGVVE